MLTDIVTGMSDGLTVPFALTAGLSGAVSSTNIIIITGIVGICGGAVVMGLGGYFTGKSEDKDTPKEFYANLDLPEELQQQATKEIEKDKVQWEDLITKPDPKRAGKSALNIGLSYAAGGLIPLSPYFFISPPITALQYSAAITILCLFVFGWFKGRVTGIKPLTAALRVTLIGAAAATAAFGVAKLFEL